jgi:hypothetical protein
MRRCFVGFGGVDAIGERSFAALRMTAKGGWCAGRSGGRAGSDDGPGGARSRTLCFVGLGGVDQDDGQGRVVRETYAATESVASAESRNTQREPQRVTITESSTVAGEPEAGDIRQRHSAFVPLTNWLPRS